jgi:hypothetical protein
MISLTKYDAAKYALQVAASVDEVKDIIDKAIAMSIYAKQANDTQLMDYANEIKARAQRKAGELLKEIPKAKGTAGGGNANVTGGGFNPPPVNKEKTLKELGISKDQSADWQKIAEIPEDRFNELVEQKALRGGCNLLKADKVWKEAEPDVKEKVLSGEVSINEAYKNLGTETKSAHVAHNSGENEWYTPSQFIEAARLTMGSIDLDPASCELANQTVKAGKIFTKKENGLDKEWKKNIWLNPPYAQPLMNQFAEKLVASLETINQAIVLVNNATETKWFQLMARQANAICFPESRIKFLDTEGKPGAPLQGQAFLYFGDNIKDFYENFNHFGFVMMHV